MYRIYISAPDKQGVLTTKFIYTILYTRKSYCFSKQFKTQDIPVFR